MKCPQCGLEMQTTDANIRVIAKRCEITISKIQAEHCCECGFTLYAPQDIALANEIKKLADMRPSKDGCKRDDVLYWGRG